MTRCDIHVTYKETSILKDFEKVDDKVINDCLNSTFVYLSDLIDEGFSVGDKTIDSLISMMGTHLKYDNGVTADHPLYKVHCKTTFGTKHVQLANFMRVVRAS